MDRSEKDIQRFIEDLKDGQAVIYEDGDLIVVSKPAGISSIPERRPTGFDLVSILSREKKSKFYVVHRLDKDVSGLILFAKNGETHRILNRFFEARLVEKTYIALVHGVVKKDEMWIRAPLRRFGSGRVGVDHRKGKESVTYLRVIKRFKYGSLLAVSPKTGRSHQIRVHLYHVGHPIMGDRLYGDPMIRKRELSSDEPPLDYTTPRLMLHSFSIKIPPHGLKDSMFFKASLPSDFRYILKNIR